MDGLRTFVRKWSAGADNLNSAIAHLLALEEEVSRLLCVIIVNVTHSLFGLGSCNHILFVEFSAQIEISGKMSESVAQNLLPRVNAFPDEKKHIDHYLRPWSKIVIAIDKDVLKRLKLLPRSFLHAKGDFVIDVIAKIIESSDGLDYFISVVDCIFHD